MSDIPPAWTTYASAALKHLDIARQESALLGALDASPSAERMVAEAQIGVGYALLALVEVLQPQDAVMLEVAPRHGVIRPEDIQPRDVAAGVVPKHLTEVRPPVPCWEKIPHPAHSHNEEGNGAYDWCPGVPA